MTMTKVLYIPGQRWFQSIEDGPGWGDRIKDLPGEVFDFEQAQEEIRKADEEHYGAGLAELIDSETWHEMLNILPPSRWVVYGPSESFRISESLTSTLSTFYVRVGDQFWRVNAAHSTSHWDLVEMCQA
jgi:hypothetical protein